MRTPTLKINDLVKIYGSSTQLKAELSDGNTPLTNKGIVFQINGVTYTRNTNRDGVASLNINLQVGTYPCTIRYPGDSTYNSVSGEVIVRVVSNNPPKTESLGKGHYFEVNKIPLHVIMSSGFDVSPGQNIKETALLHDASTRNIPVFYFNSGYDGDEFEVSIVMKEEYFYKGRQVMSYLNLWNKMNTPVSVVSNSMIVPNGKYTLQIKKKSQTLEKRSIWKLRFKQYYENSFSFESLYDLKVSTLSSIDQLLLKQVNGINEKSPRNVITALQQKMKSLGYWPMDCDGYYSGIPSNIWVFQANVMKDRNKSPGVNGVDYETITSLIQYSYGGSV